MGLKVEKRHLQIMGFKVQKKYQEITHFSLSPHHGKISLGLKDLDLNQKVRILILHKNKQNNNILKLINYTKTKCIQLKKMTNKNKINKQNTKQRKKNSRKSRKKYYLCCQMKLVGVAPSSSICIKE